MFFLRQRVLVMSFAVLAAGWAAFAAPVNITSISTVSTNGASGRRQMIDNVAGDPYRFDYMGDSIALRSVIADGTRWTAALANRPDEFVIRTNTVTSNPAPTRELVWQQYSSITEPSGGSSGRVYVNGSRPTDQQSTLAQNNLYNGTDNLFENYRSSGGETNGNYSNVERVDFLYDTAIGAQRYLSLIVLERGMANQHDGFQVAAVLSRDPITGLPTSYGQLLSIGPGWGTSNLGDINTTVVRRDTSSGSWTYSANVTGQQIGGVLVHLTDLVATGTPIFGYSLFASDVNPNTHNLLQWTSFPTNTNSGLDMVAANVGILDGSPEPGTLVTLVSGGLLLAALARRRRS